MIIKNFNVNNIHVWDNFFAIALPMKLFLKSLLGKSTFSKDWKESCFASIHKKESEGLVKIYQPIKLFPVVSEILESLISYSLFTQNNLLRYVNLVLYQEITKTWFYHLCKVKLSNLSRFCLSHFQQLNFNPHLLRNFTTSISSHLVLPS